MKAYLSLTKERVGPTHNFTGVVKFLEYVDHAIMGYIIEEPFNVKQEDATLEANLLCTLDVMQECESCVQT